MHLLLLTESGVRYPKAGDRRVNDRPVRPGRLRTRANRERKASRTAIRMKPPGVILMELKKLYIVLCLFYDKTGNKG